MSMNRQVPAVVRLRKAFRRHRKPVKFSRVNIYARTATAAQYCAVKCSIDELTYDHVIRARAGGRTTWENIVSCCYAGTPRRRTARRRRRRCCSARPRSGRPWIPIGPDPCEHQVGPRRVA